MNRCGVRKNEKWMDRASVKRKKGRCEQRNKQKNREDEK